MKPRDHTTTAINRNDLAFFRRIKEKEGYASVRVVLSKVVKIIKKHKFEEELI